MKLIFLARIRKKVNTSSSLLHCLYYIRVSVNICSDLQGVRTECLSDTCANLMLYTQLSTNIEKNMVVLKNVTNCFHDMS